jgi:hypothetical protein
MTSPLRGLDLSSFFSLSWWENQPQNMSTGPVYLRAFSPEPSSSLLIRSLMIRCGSSSSIAATLKATTEGRSQRNGKELLTLSSPVVRRTIWAHDARKRIQIRGPSGGVLEQL